MPAQREVLGVMALARDHTEPFSALEEMQVFGLTSVDWLPDVHGSCSMLAWLSSLRRSWLRTVSHCFVALLLVRDKGNAGVAELLATQRQPAPALPLSRTRSNATKVPTDSIQLGCRWKASASY